MIPGYLSVVFAAVCGLAAASEGPRAPIHSYKSPEYAERAAAESESKVFRATLEKANYEVVKVRIEKEPTASEEVFQHSFIVAYGARPGFQFQPIRRAYRDGFSTKEEAKKYYNEWVAGSSKRGEILLLAEIRSVSPPPDTTYFVQIEFVSSLKRKQ